MGEDQLEKDGEVLAVFAQALSQFGIAGVYSNVTALMIRGLISKGVDPATKDDLEAMLIQVNDVTAWLCGSKQQLLKRVQDLNLAGAAPDIQTVDPSTEVPVVPAKLH